MLAAEVVFAGRGLEVLVVVVVVAIAILQIGLQKGKGKGQDICVIFTQKSLFSSFS